MTMLSVSVGVVMAAASVTRGVGYAWQICLLYNNFISGVELIINANQHQH